MKAVLNLNRPDAVASSSYSQALALNTDITVDDRANYENYDIALFLTYDEDLVEMKKVKQKYPSLLTGIIDPRGSKVKAYINFVDFFVIDSIEMKDFFAGYGKPMFSYYEYPMMNPVSMRKNHIDKDKIILGYHGNKLHLDSMFPKITKALEAIAEKYDIELWAVYNQSRGKSVLGIPSNLKVRHISWDKDVYNRELSQVDIGIIPALMPIKNEVRSKDRLSSPSRYFNENQDDYLLRFKMPSNPGRFITFGLLDIPVVSDFFPSAIQFIQDEENGFLANSTGGWYNAIEQLIQSAELRNRLASGMRDVCDRYFDYSVQNKKFSLFLEKLLDNSIIPPTQIEEAKGDLISSKQFKKYIRQRYLRRVRNKLKRILKG